METGSFFLDFFFDWAINLDEDSCGLTSVWSATFTKYWSRRIANAFDHYLAFFTDKSVHSLSNGTNVCFDINFLVVHFLFLRSHRYG
ncbi:MAG: hypothetical protein PUP93_25925 [Rhizonema sp. NSF051]|nr:hypothetical protein [Rhizonema sp. NSF051]